MSIASLIQSGTTVWLDGVEPEQIRTHRARGTTGATSNPAIVSKVVATSHCGDRTSTLIAQGLDDNQIAWQLDDELVKSAQRDAAAEGGHGGNGARVDWRRASGSLLNCNKCCWGSSCRSG